MTTRKREGSAALADARDAALEEAATLCDKLADGAPALLIQRVCKDIAAAIRAAEDDALERAERALAVVPPERLDLLADWLDIADDLAEAPEAEREAQRDLRLMAILSRGVR